MRVHEDVPVTVYLECEFSLLASCLAILLLLLLSSLLLLFLVDNPFILVGASFVILNIF